MFFLIFKILVHALYLWRCCEAEGRVKYTGYATHRFVPQTEKARDILKILEERNPGVIFLKQVGGVNKSVDVLFPPHLQTDLLTTLSKEMSSTVVSEDMEAMIAHETNIMKLEALTEGSFPFDIFWDLKTVNSFYEHLVAMHPKMCSIEKYGKSFENRELQAIVVSEEFPVPADKPVLFMDAGTHAREWITVSSCCYFLNEAVSDKPEFVELRKNFVIVASCVTNPDGYVYSWTIDRMWRKTRADNKDILCKGVDPNRNWDFGYGGEGSSTDKCSEIYRGSGPFSIPETRHLRDYMLSKNIKSYCNLHSYSQLILLSYGCTKEQHEYKEFEKDMKLASDTAKALKAVHGTTFGFGNSKDILYEACGCANDWAKSKANVPFSYTFELRDAGDFGFVLPSNQIRESGEEMTASIIQMHKEIVSRLQSTESE